MTRTMELEKNYRPEKVENKWYRIWEKNKTFSASVNKDKKPFCIVIPPPNITGSLHMGHALNNTLQDVLVRFKRMRGFESLWIPGTDHAGIATQRVVEKELLKEGIDRWQLGREKFIEKVWEWKEEYGRRIIEQLKRMGCSCDWDRERFTLDEGCSKAVREAFVQLYEKGAIYRGERIINWCPHCFTALSDLEVEHEDVDGKLYYIRYPGQGEVEGITIATTRPETILADTAVAVNPEDERYKHLLGKNVILPIVGRKLPVIADSYVDMEFGTGALKITPAHDENDFEVGQRHNLPTVVVINDKGVMNEQAGKYEGMDRFECRKAIVKDLKEQGFLLKIEDYDMAVGTCYRCHNVIEPYLSEQWFVSMDCLKTPAMKKVEDGETRFFPPRFRDMYLSWMKDMKDWCISRQLWWGHRIPVWTCQDCDFEGAFREDPDKCPRCESENLKQDEYVLDTWFSSGLWPFSTMGWPQKTPELEYFYPTSVLSTARDIIYLWVARMMMFGMEFMKEKPFNDVFIHATILTRDGRRMSKSLGTGIDPLDLFDKYGTDATRFGLLMMTEQGQDIKFTEEKIEMGRNFANKIWNATRYILSFLPESHLNYSVEDFELNVWDRWILSRLNSTILKVTRSIEEYHFDEAAKLLYSFFWDEFCDWYIEISKIYLYSDDEKDMQRSLWILETVLYNFLKLAHPLMPFITEEIWSYLPSNRLTDQEKGENLLILADWAVENEDLIDQQAEEEFATIMEVVKALRNMRAEIKLSPRQEAPYKIEAPDEQALNIIKRGKIVISHLAVAEKIDLSLKTGKKHFRSLSARVGEIDLFLPIAGLVDIDKEIKRLEKEKNKLEKLLVGLEKKCSNENFLTKANPEVVEREKNRLESLKDQKRRIEERMEMLAG